MTRPSIGDRKAKGQQSPIVLLLMALILLSLAGGMVWVGWDAIRQRHIELTWRAWSTFRGSSHGTEIFEGGDAVLYGSGLIAFGAMLATWAFGVTVALVTRRQQSHGPPAFRALYWLSFVCLVTAIGILFPPWLSASLPFWSVPPVVAFLIGLPRGKLTAWGRRFFLPGVIGALVLVGNILDEGTAASMAGGLVASIGVLVHLVVLFPGLERRLLSADPSPSPNGGPAGPSGSSVAEGGPPSVS